MGTGEPCSICFSDTGVLTGCDRGHVVCHGCLRMGLRVVVGDVTQKEGLLCGCLTFEDTVALEGLAEKADITTQECLTTPSTDANARTEFDMEMASVRRAFQLADRIPPDVYRKKVREWFELLRKKENEHLYHACHHPGCSMDNYILIEEFDREYRSRGLYNWTCKRGHKNCVLPSQDDINEMNRAILTHPEYYDSSCGYDRMALRRYRLCAQCVQAGLLTFAVHESGCKQWPSGSGHRHCFCFHCTSVWGSGCNHSTRCADPGIQQVRRSTESDGNAILEIGFIDGEAYINWVQGRSSTCPPTVFRGGSHQVLGATRQGILGLENREVLKGYIREGTT